MNFGEILKELRLKNDLTQEQLARKLDIVTRTYIYYETGKKFPSLDLLTRITKYFKVTISFTINEHGEYIALTQETNRESIGAKQLIEEFSSLFENGELSEAEKDTVFKALHEAYKAAKKKNK